MRILVTNQNLDARGGAQSFVRDLARALQDLGHSVIAYSSDLANRERLLETDVIPVATDLENLPFKPDIIHGQHHLDAMTAVMSLPGVPAVFHCHGAVWRDCLPKHPRIYQYMAMSRTLRERMAAESNIAESKISVVLNGVDLARFSQVRTPSARPVRALFYNSRQPADGDAVVAVKEAASCCGLDLDLVGYPFGNITAEPEKLLPQYDLVFASGISAIEAMASGCAVIVLGRTSCGEMVQADNYERLRQVNFSIASNSDAPSVARIEAQIRRFSAADAAQVTARLRRDADFRQTVKEMVGIYGRAIEQHRACPQNPQEEALAAARYLRSIVPLIAITDKVIDRKWWSPPREASFEQLNARVASLERDIRQFQSAASAP